MKGLKTEDNMKYDIITVVVSVLFSVTSVKKIINIKGNHK